jgi:phasin family protein
VHNFVDFNDQSRHSHHVAAQQTAGLGVASIRPEAMDETMSTFRAMATVKSVKEAMDLQASLARSTMEKAVAQTSHVAETTFKLAEQAIAPIASRMTIAADTFKPN